MATIEIKLYNDEIKKRSFGKLQDGADAGKYSYINNPRIKQVKINNKWEDNPGYDLSKVKENLLNTVETDDKFISYLCFFNGVDDWIAAESNAKIKAAYTAIKTNIVIPYLQAKKQEILDNS